MFELLLSGNTGSKDTISGVEVLNPSTAMTAPARDIKAINYGPYIYTFGGLLALSTVSSAELWRYHVTDNTWELVSTAPTANRYPHMVVFEEKIYIFLGGGASYQTYDLVTGIWESFTVSGTAVVPRYGCTFVYNGKIWTIGGPNATNVGVSGLYTLENNTWVLQFAVSRANIYLAGSIKDNKLYTLFGNISSTLRTDGAVYDLNTGSQITLPNYSEINGHQSNQVVTYKDKIFSFGGTVGGGVTLDYVIEFDPSKNKYARPMVMPSRKQSMAAVARDEGIFVFSGAASGNSNSIDAALWKFT